MRSVMVKQNTCIVVVIVCVAGNVIASFNNETPLAKLTCNPFRKVLNLRSLRQQSENQTFKKRRLERPRGLAVA